MANADVATQFTGFYYSTFDDNRSNLAGLYRDASVLTWEGEPFIGAAAIVQKLSSLPFTKVVHKVSTVDAQPVSTSTPGLFVLVSGLLVIDDSPNPLQFSQAFHLIQDGGSYYVLNDVFRLIYSL